MIELQRSRPVSTSFPALAFLGLLLDAVALVGGAVLVWAVAWELFLGLDRAGFFQGLLGSPGELEALPTGAVSYLLVALAVAALSLIPALAFWVLRTAVAALFAEDCHLEWEEWTFRRCLARVQSDLEEQLSEDEEPLGVLEVDGPASLRSPNLLFLTQGLLVLVAVGLGYGAFSLAGVEPLSSEVYVLVGAFVFPLLAWVTAFFGPLGPLTVLLTLGLTGFLPLAMIRLIQPLASWLSWNPLLWGALLISLGIALFLCLPRKRLFLLITSRGLRAGQLTSGGDLPGLGFPRTPIGLFFSPGTVRSAWTIHRHGRDPLEVHPGRTDPARVVRTLGRAGFEMEVGGNGGRAGFAEEADRIGAPALVPLLLLLLLTWLGAGYFHSRALFSLNIGGYVEAGRVEDGLSARRAVEMSDYVLDSYPSNLGAREVRIVHAMQSGRTDLAREGLKELHRTMSRVGIPPILGHSGHGSFPEHIERVLPCFESIHDRPARGWEPTGEALWLYRHGAALTLGFPHMERLNLPGAAVRSFIQSHERDRTSPAPAVMLAWHFFQDHPQRVALYAEAIPEYQGRAPEREKQAGGEVYRATVVVKKIADALEKIAPEWDPLTRLLRRSLPAELLDTALGGMRDGWLSEGRIDKWATLAPFLKRTNWVRRTPSFQYDPEKVGPGCLPLQDLPPMQRFLLDPPRSPEEIRKAWPELTAGPDARTARLVGDLKALLDTPEEDLYSFFRERPHLFGGADGIPAPRGEHAVRAMSVGLMKGE